MSLSYIRSPELACQRFPEIGQVAFWRFADFNADFFKSALQTVQSFNDITLIHKKIEAKIETSTTFVIVIGLHTREEYAPAACFQYFHDGEEKVFVWPNTPIQEIERLLTTTSDTYVWPLNIESHRDPGRDYNMELPLSTERWSSGELMRLLKYCYSNSTIQSRLRVVVRLPTLGLANHEVVHMACIHKSIKIVYLTKMKKLLMSRIKWVTIFLSFYAETSLKPGGQMYKRLCIQWEEHVDISEKTNDVRKLPRKRNR